MIGRYAVKSMLFPYSNNLVKAKLEGQMNRRFGTEFIRILKRTADYLESFYQQKIVNRDDKKDASKASDESAHTNVVFIFESRFY
jgi:hypothetical protein